MYIPERGDIVWIDFSLQKGREQAFRRPALVLSRKRYNKIGLLWIVPITSKTKGYFFEYVLPENQYETKGYVLTDQVKCFD